MASKILIIDNDQGCLEALKEALEYWDFDVLTDEGNSDLFGLLREFEPDLVLVDYLLDGINGGEYCSMIKKDLRWSDLPVIIISAHPKVIESLGLYGCDFFMAKPLELEELADNASRLIAAAKTVRKPFVYA